jgi:hypothetical protein
MKKILASMLVILGLFLISGCGGERKMPTISNPKDVYLEAVEGEFTYTILNQRMYDKMKKQYGINILLDLADEYLMQNIKKDGVSYWDAVTEERIEEELTNDIFPDGTDGLTEEEITTERNEYMEDLFINYGLVSEQDVIDYYRLLIAKETYTRDQLTAKYEEKDFTDKEYEKYYNDNYQKGYYAIIVAYDSIKQYQDALKQLGIRITTAGQWVWIGNSIPLTDQEIVKALIDLYNTNNSYLVEGYPNQTLTLKQGEQYNLVDGKIVFDLEKIDMLYYTHKDITNYQSEIRDLMDKQMTSYPEGDFWYTKQAQAYKNGSRHAFVLEIGEQKFEFEDVKAEIKTKLLEAQVTNINIAKTFAQLRQEKGFVIYDRELDAKYESLVKSYIEYAQSKKGHGTIVAKIEDYEITADDLFVRMSYNYGISTAASELEYLRYLYNTNLNKIYDVKAKKALNANKWSVIETDAADEKKSFNDNAYADYGYPKKYGWKNFLRDFYGVNNDEELKLYYLFQDIRNDYASSVGDVSEVDEDDELWQFYLTQMNKQVEKFYNVSAIQLLITLKDKSGNNIDPAKWTDGQKTLAEEFYRQVIDYLESATGSYEKKMKDIVDAYQKAPRFLAGRNQNADEQPVVEGADYVFNGIQLSKFKTAGLVITYQDLGTFKNGSYGDAFDAVVHAIWEADPDSETPYLYGHEDEEYQYLVTTRGYHVYVNKKSIDIPKWKDGDEKKVLPTLEKVKVYLNNENDKSLTSELKTAITTYFQPIKNEFSGSNNVARLTYSALKEFQYDFKVEDFEQDDFFRYLDIQIQRAEDALKYK